MLFKNIISFSLLAFQAGLSVAGPIKGHFDESIVEFEEPDLERRAEKEVFSGTEVGSEGDTILTYGLATCAGLAAVGNPGPGGINKVMAHVQCSPDAEGETFQTQADTWAQTVRDAGITDLKIVVDIVDVNLIAGPLQGAQNMINDAAKGAAQSLGVGFATHYRKSLADPRPSGELKINVDRSITIGGQRVRV